MPKKRVHEIAKEQGVPAKELIAKLQAAGVEAKAPASTVEEAAALKALEGSAVSPPETASNGAAAAGSRVLSSACNAATPSLESRARTLSLISAGTGGTAARPRESAVK